MMQPSVSILAPVYRPGGLDVTFAGLREQTFRDFELILVDRRFEKRHDRVMELAHRSGVPTIHVPEHRRNGKWAILSSAWNTGIMLARGKTILLMPDYAYVPPNWVEWHAGYQERAEAVFMAPYLSCHLPPICDKAGNPVYPVGPEHAGELCPVTTEMPDDRFDEISIFRKPFDLTPGFEHWPDHLQDPRRDMKILGQHPPLHGHFHMRNESMPREWALEMNGFDENLDRGKSHIDLEFGRRLAMQDYPMFPVSEPMCWILNPRGLFPTMPQCGEPGRWAYEQCEGYALGTETPVAPNPYSLREKAKEIAHWRNGGPISVEGLDVPDEEYYR